MPIATAHIQPRGPWSLPHAADVLHHWAPVRRFAADESASITVGFLSDADFRPVAVRLRRSQEAGPVELTVAGSEGARALAAAVAQSARMFCLDVDGTDYPSLADHNPALAPLMTRLAGLRPVLFASAYEAAIWAVLSARVSMPAAARLQQRLIAGWGLTAGEGPLRVPTLPAPEVLRRVTPDGALSDVKVSRLHAVADAAERGVLDVAELRRLEQAEACARLQTIPGIGPFWALGIYVRACAPPDVFPDEPIAVAALGRLLGLGEQPEPATVARITEQYAPFRSWVCFLLRVAAARGVIPGISGREMEIRRASGGRTRQPALARG